MRYRDLHELIFSSSSSRKYFLELPVEVQMKLHAINDFIRTQDELRRSAEYIDRRPLNR